MTTGLDLNLNGQKGGENDSVMGSSVSLAATFMIHTSRSGCRCRVLHTGGTVARVRRLRLCKAQAENLWGPQTKLDKKLARLEQLYEENRERLDDFLKGLHEMLATKENIPMESLISAIDRSERIDHGWMEGSPCRSQDSANV